MDERNGERGLPGADTGWTESEFEGIELGDARLERRLRRVAEELSHQPEYPINQASEDAAATKAAYRLFDNERVGPDRILKPHREQTLKRMREEAVVLALQDTSFFNFTRQKRTRGLGPIGDSTGNLQGLLLHSVLAVTPKGLPLGLLWQRCWAREGFRESEDAHAKLPIEEKESYRWVEALRETATLTASKASGSMVVTVADRESDIYEFLLEAQTLNAKYVIRACYDRCIESPEYKHIHALLNATTPQGTIELEIPTQKRRAKMEVTFVSVTISPPHRKTPLPKREPVRCWAIKTQEINPPDNQSPLSWVLLTSIPVVSAEQAAERIAWYRKRWAIEEFHKIIKSGCAVEDCRLQTADRLKKYIALFCVIAWRIFWMVHIKRAHPNAPADVALTTAEIGTLCSLDRFKKRKLSPKTLTVNQAVVAIACLGGYLNRKNDPPPGPTVLWRGWQRLSSMTELYDSIIPGCG